MPNTSSVSFEQLVGHVRHANKTSTLVNLFHQFHAWVEVPTHAASVSKADIVGLAVQVKNSHPDIWTPKVAVELQHILTTLATVTGPDATRQVADESKDGSDFSSCDPVFADIYKRFYSPNESVVFGAASEALSILQSNRNLRPHSVSGTGAKHLVYLGTRPGALEFRLLVVKLLADAALSDESEDALFQAGGLEMIMEVGRQATHPELQQHAARMFFNFSYLKHNRLSFIKKGGLSHLKFLVHQAPHVQNEHSRLKLILSTAKTMSMLANHPDCCKQVLEADGMVDVWVLFAKHPVEEVRQRAACVMREWLRCTETRVAAVKIPQFLQELQHGLLSTDTNPRAQSLRGVLGAVLRGGSSSSSSR